MGAIKIQITELTVPNDFKIYYKAGTNVAGLSPGINPYPFDDSYIDYGQVFLGGTTTIDLIGDFVYGQVYWIMAKEINYPERWMAKNIKINAEVIYQSFLAITPTPQMSTTITPTTTPSRTPLRSPTTTPTITPTNTITPSKTPSTTITPSKTPSTTITPSKTPTPSRTTFWYAVEIYNCSGVVCTTTIPIGYAPIRRMSPLTIGKFYSINDQSGDIIKVVSTATPNTTDIIIRNGPFNSCNEACAAF